MNNAQVRIYELSKELNLENKELLAICDQLNIVVKSHSSNISEFDAGRIRLAAKKFASTNGIQQELAITSYQPNSPKTISPNRLAPLHKQQTSEIPKPKIKIPTNPASNTPKPIPPRVLPQNLLTEDHLRIWEVFLQIEEKIAKTRQFCVPFFSHNGFGRRITFEIDVTSATLDGSDENSLAVENFWERVKRAKNEEVKLFETTPKGQNWRNSRQLGIIEEVLPNSCVIRVRLERDLAEYMAAGRYQLPAIGFLFFEAVGDIQQIKRKKAALTQLKQGHAQNLYLGNFLFDASQARPIQKIIELKPEDLLLSSANPSQKAAVETVLAAEDLVLIQGPPGTGKTTVIAEICYQVALRGGRTLITSQANLAVDNALSRLVHNPLIRAVRKGNAERVGEQGQPFLENRVIGTWLENTATDCEKNLAQRLDNVKVLRQLLASSQRFIAYLEVEEVFKREQDLLQTRKTNLESACTTQKNEYNQAASQLGEVESLKTALEELLNQAPSVDWQDPALLNLWAGLNKYTSTDASLRNFAANLRLAINLASELGMVKPNHGLFGLAGWLQNAVASWITEVRTALAYASNIAIAMTEAELAAQTYTQNSESLARLKLNHQQLLINQQSLHQRIRNLHNRESEVNLAINDLDIWLSTANLNIANVLKECLQNRQEFTVDLILLPSVLRSMTMEAQYQPWQQSLEQCRVKVNELIQKYHERDRRTLAKVFCDIMKNLPICD